MSSTGGAYDLGGTIGQPDAGRLTGGTYTLDGGFWGIAATAGGPTPTRTATPASAYLVAHVQWQSRPVQPNALNVLPVTETLRLTTGGALYTFNGTTDASGFFTSNVSLLPAGTYNIRIQGRQWLATCSTVTLTGTGTIQKDMGLQKAGDTNYSNTVNATDFSTLKGTFGKGIGDPGYNSLADFNGDNAVTSTDFNQVKNNFGQAGCVQSLAP